MQTNTIQLKLIRSQLLRGGVKEIAELAGTSVAAVTHVFQGRYFNEKIVEAIITVGNAHKQRRKEIQSRLFKLSNKIEA